MNKLSDAKVRSARPKEKDYKLADGGNMYLLVKASGTKLWRMNYRRHGKSGTLSFGKYPVVTLTDARALRTQAQEDLALGKDPRRIKTRGGTVGTFGHCAQEWWDKQAGSRWSDRTAVSNQRIMQNDILPALASRPVEEVTGPEVLAVLRKIEGRGAIETAHKARQIIGQVFRYAVACGLRDRDPVADLRGAIAPKPRRKHFTKIEFNELVDFYQALSRYGREDNRTRIAIELVMHTFVRTKEIRFASWEEFDLGGGMWRIPEERMKMGREHLVPLTPRVLELLEELGPAPTGYLFPGRHKGVMSENTMLFALYAMGYKRRQTMHGFRGIASTALYESLKFPSNVIEMQLAHADTNEVRAAYNSSQLMEARREMMTWWSDLLESKRRTAEMLG
jgi:integrase